MFSGEIMSMQRKSRSRILKSYLLVAPALLIIAALIACFAFVARARTELLRPTQTDSPALSAKPVSMTSSAATPLRDNQASGQRMEPLIIKLRRTGFEPAEITRLQGRFLLAFDNLTGADEIDLQLNHETGNKLHEVRMPRGQVRWRQALDLHPGRYVLSVVDHPEWVCQLTITAR